MAGTPAMLYRNLLTLGCFTVNGRTLSRRREEGEKVTKFAVGESQRQAGRHQARGQLGDLVDLLRLDVAVGLEDRP